MEQIIDKLYEAQYNSKNFFMEDKWKESGAREWELYTLLYERLEEEDKKLLLEYIKLKGERQNEELKASFRRGVQTAMRLS